MTKGRAVHVMHDEPADLPRTITIPVHRGYESEPLRRVLVCSDRAIYLPSP